MITANLEHFNGKPVVDYNPETGIENTEVAYRLRIDYEQSEQNIRISDWLRQIAEHPNAAQLEELVIGTWNFEGEPPTEIIQTLIENKDQFQALKALMIGDITYEEQEISWIQQSDLQPLLEAYPYLRWLQARGGNGLRLSNLTHTNLQTLILESGGLFPDTIQDVIEAKLPNLEHLELWLGSSSYGFESSVDDLLPLMNKSKFPQLNYLGLRDSEIADEIAQALRGRSVMDIIEVLDLSMGTLGDKGAEDLFENNKIHRLKLLDLHYHYLSEAWMEKLKTLNIAVDLSDKQTAETEEDKYVAVAE